MELSEYLAMIKKRFWMILLAAVIASVSAWAVSKFLIERYYESTTAIILSWPNDLLDMNGYGPQDALLSSNYIKIFNNLTNSESLYQSIIDRLTLDTTVEKLKMQIGITVDFDTGIMKISVKSKDPGLAREISQAFVECLREQSYKLSLKADIKIIDEPNVPPSPLFPNITLNILLSAIGGILAGILMAILLGIREQSNDETLSAQKHPGLRVLGSLPKLCESGLKNDPIIIFQENSSQNEAIKLIRTKLQFLLDPSGEKAIIVTSPAQAEGKTTLAVNIAISLAHMKKNVLLIDCNFHRPALNMIYNLMDYNRILHLLEKIQGSIYKIYRIYALDIDLLSEFDTSINQTDNIIPQMNAILDTMTKKYDYVILDCPPISYSDTITLSALIRNVVIVANYGNISYQTLGKYNSCLNQVGANILGIVVNQTPQARTRALCFNQIQDIKPGILCKDIKKRILDISIALFLLLAATPLMLIISLLILATSKGPIIFRHKRIGYGGKEFYLYKFRTMRQDAEKMKSKFTAEQQAEFLATFKLRNDPRVTPFGKILRKTSMDELPQFVNVLRGDMSIVGPRPITREEFSKYGIYSDMLLSVNPGITGLWQVSGRSDISYEERVRLDVKYIMHHDFWIDLKILLSTFGTIASRMGAF